MEIDRTKTISAIEEAEDTDKLSYEIFSILESKFLFGYDDDKVFRINNSNNANESSYKNQRGKVRVLCIDGGAAMRGILPAKALQHLEQSLKAKSGDPNARISDFFDLAAGSGVGGLFVTMLFASNNASRPLFDAKDTSRFVLENSKCFARASISKTSAPLFGCFSGGSARALSTSTVAMEKAMKEVLGEELSLRDTLKPVLIPCYDLRTSAPLVFSRADALESPSFDFKLWEVARATWAEPARFEPMEMRSVDGVRECVGVDGGLAMMNNPAVAAITHVLHNKQEFPFVRGVEDLLVLSLGCGATPAPLVASGELHKLRRWGGREWCRPVGRIAADGSADLVDHAVALAFGQCRNSNYVRIQANVSSVGRSGVDVDSDPSPSNVKMLMTAAEEMLKQKNVESVLFSGRRIREQTNMEKLDWFANELVLEHQRRSCRIAPTVAFKQPTPKSSA